MTLMTITVVQVHRDLHQPGDGVSVLVAPPRPALRRGLHTGDGVRGLHGRTQHHPQLH